MTSPSGINTIYLIDIEREGTVVNEGSTACHEVSLVRDLNQKVLKFLVFLFNSSLYSPAFVLEPLCFVEVFFMLFSCSISINFPWLWKTWFNLLTCWYGSIALGFFMYFQWCLSFMWKGVSDFPTSCVLQRRYSNTEITFTFRRNFVIYVTFVFCFGGC